MTYTVWHYHVETDQWLLTPTREFDEEWEAYFVASMKSTHHGYTTLRDGHGDQVYAVFSWGMRIWHTLEANHG